MSGASRFFSALGDETRLALLAELRSGERTVGALVAALGCPQPKVSRHLKVLKDAGLVRDRREGRHVTYELSTPGRWDDEARRWLDRLDQGLPLSAGTEGPAPATPSRPGANRVRDRAPRRPPDLETHLL
jgi:DNA-binding transcriptional ArsR family regulator